ncbi:zinc finger protein 511 isoform X5 [Parus major]|uniref:zinc finger protein 511 isoform X5 n=1 Tax=Parus major TaxID=9157 RepID=UPI0007711BBE|nr:zinc finger protein 511 isoform X5 [Parus major]
MHWQEDMDLPALVGCTGCHLPEQQDLDPSRAREGLGSAQCHQGGTWIRPVPPGRCRPGRHGPGKVRGRCGRRQPRTAMGLRSVSILLGIALLLLAPGNTQALSSSRWKDLDTEQDLAEEIILGVEANKPSEGEPGIKVFSGSAWAQRAPPQVQHPQDDAREASARVPFWMLAPKVQNGPEEDRDHLYHPEDDAREDEVYKPLRMLSVAVQNDPEEDRDHIYHS